ncbi:MAG: bifunctional oligoribonuclease/PAP phosphatase NrnA [Patescibacteria group bacterium]|nr:bifunctional oligoribonuclease/PAP phosphatase NrnA [Patescibacteria group bacterium]MDD4303887.1 bifunctional oligoribonuclease/PAP phosphatase NrnA [Patescibacteria group bacterium]MDD4695126.1 bifunctional oligoribonuclease/PAP phosphatase NrnA [Patescibacteria group bacterium]
MLVQEAKELYTAISQSQSILIVTHRNPDGDAIGSSLAFYNFLKSINKNVKCFCKDTSTENFNYLENIEQIQSDISILNEKYELCLIVDCGDLSMTKINDILENKNFEFGIANIDHHETNPEYGKINIVIKNASSTSEIIYLLLNSWKINIDPKIATNLITGIITDTNNFTNGGTTKQSIEISSRLLSIGANIGDVLKAHVYNKTINILKLWGIILKRMIFSEKLSMVNTVLFDTDLENLNLEKDAAEGVSNYLNNLSKDIKFSLLLKDDNRGTVRGSFRTTRDDIDVSKIAKTFGGGGHKKAAGFETSGHVELKNNIWQIVK